MVCIRTMPVRSGDKRRCTESQQIVGRPAAPFRGNPVDHLVGIHDVAGLAVDTVGGIDLKTSPGHFIHSGRTEVLTRVPILVRAAWMANGGLEHDKMNRLVFVVSGS